MFVSCSVMNALFSWLQKALSRRGCMFFQIMEVLKSVIDIIKYAYCWCSDTAEMCLLFYAENCWDIEFDFNSTVDVSKTSTCEPKKTGTVDKCAFWISLRNKRESKGCGNICCSFRQSLSMKPWIAASKQLGYPQNKGKPCGTRGTGSQPYLRTRACLRLGLCLWLSSSKAHILFALERWPFFSLHWINAKERQEKIKRQIDQRNILVK